MPDQNIDFVLSSDGSLSPGKKCSFLLYSFNRKNESVDPGTPLEIILKSLRKDSSNLARTDFKALSPGIYLATLTLPKSYNSPQISVGIHAKKISTPILKAVYDISPKIGLTLIPPETTSYLNSEVSFKALLFDKHSFSPIFKKPIRIKGFSPANELIINKIVATDLHGIVPIKLFLHAGSPAGIYHFEVSTQKNKTQIAIPIYPELPMNKTNNEISSALISSLHIGEKAIPHDSRTRYKIKSNKSFEILSNVKPSLNQAFLSYNCPNASIRYIEIWQNGNRLYNSSLILATGRVALPLIRGLNPDIPVRFKIWGIANNKLISEDYVWNFKGKKKLPIKHKVMALNRLLEDSSEPLATLLMSSHSPTFLSNKNQTSFKHPDSAIPSILHHFEPIAKPDFSPIALIKDKTLSRKKFIIVKKQISLSHYRFNQLKIHLAIDSFLRSALQVFEKKKQSLRSLILEIQLRIALLPYLASYDQPKALERLEGMVPALSDYISEIQVQKLTSSEIQKKKLVNILIQLKKLIYLPDRFIKFIRKNKNLSADITQFGPLKPNFPNKVSLDQLMNATKPLGAFKLNYKKGNKIFHLKQEKSIINIPLNKSGTNRLRSIENLRNMPLLIELDFKDQR